MSVEPYICSSQRFITPREPRNQGTVKEAERKIRRKKEEEGGRRRRKEWWYVWRVEEKAHNMTRYLD